MGWKGCSKQWTAKVVKRLNYSIAHVAQSVEHILGKDEVTSSILVVGSIGECVLLCEASSH